MNRLLESIRGIFVYSPQLNFYLKSLFINSQWLIKRFSFAQNHSFYVDARRYFVECSHRVTLLIGEMSFYCLCRFQSSVKNRSVSFFKKCYLQNIDVSFLDAGRLGKMRTPLAMHCKKRGNIYTSIDTFLVQGKITTCLTLVVRNLCVRRTFC